MRNLLPHRLMALLFILPFLTACGFEVVDTGHRGVKTNFGEVIGEGLSEGLYFYNPFSENIVEMNVQTNSQTFNTESYSRDNQQVKGKCTISYNLDPSKAADTYRTVGHDWAAKFIPQIIADSMETAIGKWEAENIPNNREQLKLQAKQIIAEALAKNDIILTSFAIDNLDYTKEFEQAVEAKVVAIQKAHAEKNKTVQIEEQAKQTVFKAQAEAESMRIRARALESNPKLVEYEAVQKWNGVLPSMMTGNSVPFINLTK